MSEAAQYITDPEQVADNTRFVTLAGMVLNIFLTLIKVLAGYFGGSQSVIADGIHSLTDCSTDIAVLVGLKYWNQPPDTCHPYGHRRIETMVSVLIGLILVGAGIFLGIGSIEKLLHGQYAVPAGITLFVALTSVLIKELLYRWTINVAQRCRSSALRANAWHHRTDSLSSIAVSFAIGMAMLDEKWAVLDPLAAFAVGLFIIQAAVKIVWPSLKELADTGADEDTLEELKKIVLQIDGIVSVHALRSRFHGDGLQVDLHIQVPGHLSVTKGHMIAGIARRRLLEEGPGVIDVLVHVEPDEDA